MVNKIKQEYHIKSFLFRFFNNSYQPLIDIIYEYVNYSDEILNKLNSVIQHNTKELDLSKVVDLFSELTNIKNQWGSCQYEYAYETFHTLKTLRSFMTVDEIFKKMNITVEGLEGNKAENCLLNLKTGIIVEELME